MRHQSKPQLQPRKGLPAFILRNAAIGDCSANGISARHDGVVVTGVRCQSGDGDQSPARLAARRGQVEVLRQVAPGERFAEVFLVVRELSGGLYVHAEPVEGGGRWAMASGCYLDGGERLAEVARAIYGDNRSQVGPIPLHDRYEH